MDQYRTIPQFGFKFDELIIDNFCGGGGASTGIEAAIGRPVDIAINHDQQAISMHMVNHPQTRHLCESVWDVDPRIVCSGRPVGLAWFSPDCTYHSKARGGKPFRDKKRANRRRGMANIVCKYGRLVRPRIMMIENVEEFKKWGPLGLDGRPSKDHRGLHFNKWAQGLKHLGYRVEHEILRACDYGAHTTRKRLFIIARCDGLPIVWPEPTHGPGRTPYNTAADIIDWSIPCPSIFERKRPLAENTLKRIARGIERFVINNPEPFIVNLTHGGRIESLSDPLKTITAANRGEKALIAPIISRQFGKSVGHRIDEPCATITAGGGGKSQLVTAFLAKHFGGMTGVGIDTPFPTVTKRGTQNQLVTSHLIKLRGTCRDGQPVTEPMPTITAGGLHIGEVRAFLMKYYSNGSQWQGLDEPLHTVPTKARLGLVVVHGEPYQIVDIGMRMLEPHELYAAHDFPSDYIIDRDAEGNKITKTEQIAKCGNSVPPPPVEALVRANFAANERYKVA